MTARIRYFILMILFLGGLHAAIGEDCCDPSMIGDTNVAGRLTNGKLAGDRWMVVSNTLVCIHTEVAPLQDPAGSADSDPSLKLMFHPSDAPDASGVKGFHGRLYLNNDQPTPVLAQTNLVDIDSAADGSRIVMMVLPNGPVFSSTNSGMTWAMINTPGRYEIPLSGGFSAAATINPVSEDLLAAHFQTNHWYAIGSARDSEQLVAVSNPYEATPVWLAGEQRLGHHELDGCIGSDHSGGADESGVYTVSGRQSVLPAQIPQ